MVKCDNCENPASYTQADPGVNPVNYCQKCLPGWLHNRALAGHFPLVKQIESEPVIETSVEEPVEDIIEETVETPIVDAPKSTKKKKSSKNANN